MSKAKREARKAEKARKKANKESAFEKKPLWLALALIMTSIAYLGIFDNSVTNYDDDIYVTENRPLLNLDLPALYGEFYWNQYSPLAMTIMGLEFKLSDGNEGFLRAVSILIHLACVLMVFLIFRQLVRDDIVAGLTALLFGVHPMQVESVAWLTASMKIGTYAFFFLLSIWAYINYKKKEDKKSLVVSLLAFLASCLCKEQAVILPVALIAVDYFLGKNVFDKKVWLEKIPFFLLSIVFGIVTFKASTSHSAEVVERVYNFGIGERILFAMYSTVMYVFKIIVPANLSMFYTYPMQGQIPAYFYLMPLLLIGLFVLLFRAYKREQRWLVFGILFFLVNVFLTAMTAVMSVRDVIMADRYVYLPAIGFFFILSYLLVKVKTASGFRYAILGIAFIFMAMSFQRVKVWKDNITLFSDVIDKESYGDRSNPYLALAYNNRGVEYKRRKQLVQANADFESAIACDPNYYRSYLNRGNIHFDAGRDDEAMENYNKVISLSEQNQKALSARGAIHAKRKNYDAALADLNAAVEKDRYFLDAYSNRALTYMDMGKFQEAADDCSTYIQYDPFADDMYEFRGYLRAQLGEFDQAIEDFNQAIAINPGNASYYFNRSTSYKSKGDKPAALRDATKARNMGYKVAKEYIDSLR